MQIQRAEVGHFAAITKIVALLIDTEFKNTPAQFNWSEQALQAELTAALTWVAFEKQQVVAFLSARILPDAYEITVLATHPEWQGRAHQAELVKSLLNQAVVEQKQLWLEVHAANAKAIGFYGKLGFKEVSRRKRYYFDGGDALVMSLG